MNRIERVVFVTALSGYFLPAYAAFWGIGVTLRWPLLLALALVVLIRIPGAASCPWPVLASLGAFSTYALVTSLWSENPLLSATKGTVFLVATLAFLLGGYLFNARVRAVNPYWPLVWIYVIAVITSVLALFTGASPSDSFFQGYTYNPNMLGSMLAFGFPWVIADVYIYWQRKRRRNIGLVLAGLGLAFLFATHSRSSLLMTACVLVGTIAGLRLKRRAVLLAGFGVLALVAYTLLPGQVGGLEREYVYKSQESVWESRVPLFSASWEKALSAGWLGVGFGVSTGESRAWNGQVTSVGFSREKGSSQLAVWEETGFVGVALGAAVLIALFSQALIFRVRLDPGASFMWSLFVGYVLGALASATFEAWFPSPGAPESAAYWGTVGIGLRALQAGRAAELRARYESAVEPVAAASY